MKDLDTFQKERENKIDDSLVFHPLHYNTEGRKECWEEMEEIFGSVAVGVFDILNAYKYYYRAGEKKGNSEAQDKAKIENYLNHALRIGEDNDVVADMYEKFVEATGLEIRNE